MNTAVMILICVLLAAVLIIAFLWTANKELNRDLDFVAKMRDEWEKRARDAGWRYPLEQVAHDLQQSTDALSAAARTLSQQTAVAQRNTEALKNLAKKAKGALEMTRAANDSLDRAAQCLQGSQARSLPPPAEMTATFTGPVRPEFLSRLVHDAVGRIEKSGGQIEPDPKKRN